MPIYRPRMAAQLTLPGPGDDPSASISLTLNVHSARWKKNDHNHADELELTLDWHDAGVDPRLLSSATVVFYLGNADESGNWTPGPEDVRFIGRMTRPARRAGEDQPMVVDCHFKDYTSFFILAKRVASKAIPTYDMTLADAWRCLCEGLSDDTGVSPVDNLKDQIEFRGLDAPGPKLGTAVAARFRQGGAQLHVDPKHDAWAIWQWIVGSVGLVSFFELDQLVVSTTTDLYTAEKTPVFIFGMSSGNTSRFEEERNNEFERKGVGITSFDPLTGTTLEAVWPPIGDPRVKGKKVKATKKAKSQAALANKEARDYFQFSGITDPDALLALAKRVYAERARQEFQGKITTHEMAISSTETVGDNAGKDFEDQNLDIDVLKLSPGDTMQVKVDELDWAGEALLQSLPSMEDRKAYLESVGYSTDVATIIAQNMDTLVKSRREFYIKTIEGELQITDDGGSFAVSIGYCNKIETTTDAIDDPSHFE